MTTPLLNDTGVAASSPSHPGCLGVSASMKECRSKHNNATNSGDIECHPAEIKASRSNYRENSTTAEMIELCVSGRGVL